MPVRSTAVMCLLLLTVAMPQASRADAGAGLLLATVPTDSASAGPVVGPARQAFQAAWAQRESGDFAAAKATIQAALAKIDTALAHDPDLAERRELLDVRSKLDGLGQAARSDASTASSAEASGNEADERVLNAPAVEEITPQFNGQVYRYIDFFTGAGRSVFERLLKRSGRNM